MKVEIGDMFKYKGFGNEVYLVISDKYFIEFYELQVCFWEIKSNIYFLKTKCYRIT